MTPQGPDPLSEAQTIDAIVAATLAKQQKKNPPGQVARRALHPKSHGTVKAKFRVRADLPPELRVGLFAQPGEFAALARFSNGALKAETFDFLPNIRGLAVKLLDVPGAKALPGEETSTEHDFILANDRVFFARKIEPMLLFLTKPFELLRWRHLHMPWRMLVSAFKLVKSPLALSYFSQVPYALGDRACKFALVPAENPELPLVPNIFDRHYLRHAAEHALRRGEVRYHFCIQLQNPAQDSIEDSTIAWTGPFTPVADLTFLPIQETLLESDGERLSFNPWRVLPAHQPLGWPGRLRRAAYAATYQWRKHRNSSQ